jgi:primosomal protein N' (replication factor Y)
MFVDVAVDAVSDHTLSYCVPGELCAMIAIGKRVLVPLGKKSVTGYIVEVAKDSQRNDLKNVLKVLDTNPLFGKFDLAFYRWAADYYMYPLGKALKTILPSGIVVKSNRWITGLRKPEKGDDLTETQEYFLSVLLEHPKGTRLNSLRKNVAIPDKDLKTLTDNHYVKIEDRLQKPAVREKKAKLIKPSKTAEIEKTILTKRERELLDYLKGKNEIYYHDLRHIFKNASSLIPRLEKKNVITLREVVILRNPPAPVKVGIDSGNVSLTGDQEKALQNIIEGIREKTFRPCLLHGVTGSGKTEVYLQAVSHVLKEGGSALVLVPEIALTPQLIHRVTDRFGEDILALLHSGITPGERYDQWRKIASGKARIILGARSAIFAPAINLKLIVIDEEHDQSYKQDGRMPYHARDLAIIRARLLSAVVILGSATPEIQSYHNTKRKGFSYLSLSTRIANRSLPHMEIIDMKAPGIKYSNNSIISRPLAKAIRETLGAGKQSLLFLNRRGFTTFLSCPDCGYVFHCSNCSVTMTHHISDNTLKCHYCNYSVKAPPLCPVCRSARVLSFGAGTEKLFQETAALFPRARIARLDSDTASEKGAYERILSDLNEQNIDILIGTQMIAKGHDFPQITLVGIVSADISLNIPDFRASERTFQLLTQVSGRGGRGDTPGRVIVQTLNPSNYAIVKAKNYDYEGFYQKELEARNVLKYPPFSRMINLRISSNDEKKARQMAQKLALTAREQLKKLNADKVVTLIGPAESPLKKIKGKYRWQLLLKGIDTGKLRELAESIITAAGKRIALNMKIDIDPFNFM